MKLKYLFILVLLSTFFWGCNAGEKPQATERVPSQLNVSGSVEGGYRHLAIEVDGDPMALTVFRGDYVKFIPSDGGDPQVDYELVIPHMEIRTTLQDNASDQPYFKMKIVGTHDFRLGNRVGTIRVVELEQANYSELSAEAAWKLINKNPPFILDVRTKPEFNRGYIKGATLLPLQELQGRVSELEMYKNQPILIYCATGNRSTTASKILLDHGFKDVMNLRMGIMGWGSKGYNIQF